MYWVPTWPSGSNSAALIVWIDSLFGRVASYDGQRLSLHRLPGQKNGAELAVQVGQLWHAHRADRRWHILVNVGPGSFTGLKVGLGSVHAMHDWLGAQGVELQIAGLRSTVALWLALGSPAGTTAALSANPGRAFAEAIDGRCAADHEPEDTLWTELRARALCVAESDTAARSQLESLGMNYRTVSGDDVARGIMEYARRGELTPWLVAAEPCYVRQPRIDTSNDWRKRMLGWDSPEPA